MSDRFFRLDGRVALVTGGGRGVGEAVCRRLAAAGAKVAVWDIDRQTAAAVAGSLGGIPVVGDITVEADINRVIAETEAGLGPVDILVNNAAITGTAAKMWELAADEMEKVLKVNVVGPFLCCRAVISGMRSRGYGRIVNVASIAGKEGNPTLGPYSASKAALIALTKSLAKEVAGQGGDITVNAISPAVIQTPMVDALPKTTVDYMVSKIPMGRTCKLEEVAALIHFLASAESSFTTGQCYDISGGRATY